MNLYLVTLKGTFWPDLWRWPAVAYHSVPWCAMCSPYGTARAVTRTNRWRAHSGSCHFLFSVRVAPFTLRCLSQLVLRSRHLHALGSLSSVSMTYKYPRPICCCENLSFPPVCCSTFIPLSTVASLIHSHSCVVTWQSSIQCSFFFCFDVLISCIIQWNMLEALWFCWVAVAP